MLEVLGYIYHKHPSLSWYLWNSWPNCHKLYLLLWPKIMTMCAKMRYMCLRSNNNESHNTIHVSASQGGHMSRCNLMGPLVSIKYELLCNRCSNWRQFITFLDNPPILVYFYDRFILKATCSNDKLLIKGTYSDNKLLVSDNKLLVSDNKLLLSVNKLLVSDNELIISDTKLLVSDNKILVKDTYLLN